MRGNGKVIESWVKSKPIIHMSYEVTLNLSKHFFLCKEMFMQFYVKYKTYM